MKGIEVKVPRNLIKKFYQHPEPYEDGYYVVDLINGMYTDVFYQEEGDFFTITNDKALISYLKKNPRNPREYFFRNGIFSFRHMLDNDYELLEEWKQQSPAIMQLELPNGHGLPDEFMFCFYWVEVGNVIIESNRMTLEVYEKELIHMIDIGVLLDLILEDLKKLDSR